MGALYSLDFAVFWPCICGYLVPSPVQQFFKLCAVYNLSALKATGEVSQLLVEHAPWSVAVLVKEPWRSPKPAALSSPPISVMVPLAAVIAQHKVGSLSAQGTSWWVKSWWDWQGVRSFHKAGLPASATGVQQRNKFEFFMQNSLRKAKWGNRWAETPQVKELWPGWWYHSVPTWRREEYLLFLLWYIAFYPTSWS